MLRPPLGARHQPVVSERLAKKFSRNLKERAIEAVLFLAAFVSVVTTAGIVYILVKESVVFFAEVPLWLFLTDTQWTPLFDDAHFGIMVLLSGTITSSLVALCVAIPLGTTIAVYLSEFASPKAREIAKPILELLAGVPTIVYGYFALLFVTPLLQAIYPSLPGFNLLSAGIVMGIMIVPTVASISEDAMRAVPMSLREGSFAMGATRLQTPSTSSCRRRSRHRRAYILGDLARDRRDDDPRGRRGHATQPDVQPDGAGGDDHRLHRAGGAGRPAARQRGLPDDLRRGPDADAAHAVLQPDRVLDAQALPGGVLTWRPTHPSRLRRPRRPSGARPATSAGSSPRRSAGT
jgi:hypothetical protein